MVLILRKSYVLTCVVINSSTLLSFRYLFTSSINLFLNKGNYSSFWGYFMSAGNEFFSSFVWVKKKIPILLWFKLMFGVPWWHSGWRIWCCQCCGSVWNCGMGLIPGPGNSTWLHHSQKKDVWVVHRILSWPFFSSFFKDTVHYFLNCIIQIRSLISSWFLLLCM